MLRANYKPDLQLARDDGDTFCFLKNLLRNPFVRRRDEALQNIGSIAQARNRFLIVIGGAPAPRGEQDGREQSYSLPHSDSALQRN
jgi:hypothetical protein